MTMKKMSVYLVATCLLMALGCSSNSDDTPEEIAQPVDRSANLLSAGDSANDILSNNSFTSMRVEIAYVTGFRPTEEAMDEFLNFLRTHTFKNDIELVFNELPSPGEETLTIQQIADLEEENRTVYNDGNTLGVYMYFADAPSDGDEENEGSFTLGAVYRNTSMVIYERTARLIAGSSLVISRADVETATINHEFGHLFGLVNFGTPAVNNHEDSEARGHCNVPGCLMRAQLQFGGSTGRSAQLTAKNEVQSVCNLRANSVLKMLETNSTSRGVVNAVPLDAECMLDLSSNGGR